MSKRIPCVHPVGTNKIAQTERELIYSLGSPYGSLPARVLAVSLAIKVRATFMGSVCWSVDLSV